jgi:hypothetical protein
MVRAQSLEFGGRDLSFAQPAILGAQSPHFVRFQPRLHHLAAQGDRFLPLVRQHRAAGESKGNHYNKEA